MLLFTIFIIYGICLHSALETIPIGLRMEDHQIFGKLILHVIDRYISPMTSTINFMERCIYCKNQRLNFQTRLLEYFLKSFRAPVAMQFFNGPTDQKPWEYNIYIVDTLIAFEQLSSKFAQTMHERDFYFLIVLTTYNRQYRYRHETMESIFQTLIDFRVVNAVILTRPNNRSYNFYTYELFEKKSCQEHIKISKINEFSNGHLKHDFLFPPLRFTNFYNCTLKISANTLPPLLFYYNQTNKTGNVENLTHLYGIEADILKLLAMELKFQIKLSLLNKIGGVDEFGNGTGCFAELLSNKTDIAIGGLSSSLQNRHFLTVSLPHYQTPYVFILRRNQRFGPIKQLALPFNTCVWSSLAFILLLTILLLLMLESFSKANIRAFIIGSKNQHSITNLITILLGNPITILPQRNFARFLLTVWMLATLVLRNAYQAKMFDSLRSTQYQPPPHSLPELIQRKYLLLSPAYMDFYPANLTFIMPDVYKFYEILENSHEHLTSTSLMDSLAYYNRYFSETSSLTYMPEPIYHFQSVMYFQKHSIFKASIEHKLQQLISSGITAHIARSYVKKKFQMLNSDVKRLPQIDNNMLRALYALYAILNGIAFSAFYLELLSKKWKRLRYIFNWLHK